MATLLGEVFVSRPPPQDGPALLRVEVRRDDEGGLHLFVDNAQRALLRRVLEADAAGLRGYVIRKASCEMRRVLANSDFRELTDHSQAWLVLEKQGRRIAVDLASLGGQVKVSPDGLGALFVDGSQLVRDHDGAPWREAS